MLNSRLVRHQDAQLHFEVMAYLIRQFGAPPRAPVPSPLHKTPGLDALGFGDLDTRSVFDWAEDHFGAIKTLCHMDGYDIELLPEVEGLDAKEIAASYRLESLTTGLTPYRTAGTTPIIYDPRDCAEPGHFAATTILQLAELRVSAFKPETVLPGLMQRMITLTAAAYNRQGFVLANVPGRVSDYLTSTNDTQAVPHRVVLNTLCFSTCLALRIKRQSPEQIIGTYGTLMTRPFRKKIRKACRQIDAQSEALATLQMLAEPPVKPVVKPAGFRQSA